MKVKATQKCFYGGQLRKRGDVFETSLKKTELPEYLEAVVEKKAATTADGKDQGKE